MRTLVADDDRITRKALARQFERWGHEVVLAADGREAWELLHTEPLPRIAVLDWMMPEIDGIELCRRLRDRQEMPLVYSILLTSKNHTEDLAEGLENGAHDFLSKPINPVELRSRVNVGCRFADYDDRLRSYATEMEELAEQRAAQLLHADRMATLGVMAAGVVHEINNPLAYIAGTAQMLAAYWEAVDPLLAGATAGGAADRRVQRAIERTPGAHRGIQEAVDRISRILNGMRTFAHKGPHNPEPCNLNACISESLELCTNTLKYHVKVHTEFAEHLPRVLADTQQMSQVFVNLFTNAAHALEDCGGGSLMIRTAHSDGWVEAVIADDGPGIAADAIEDIWTPFYTTKGADRGTGLGLAICHGIVEAHGGRIEAENRREGGACFRIALPRRAEERT